MIVLKIHAASHSGAHCRDELRSARTNRQHVEEVVSCGQFGDTLGQHQAGGTYPKSCLGPLPCLGEALSIEQPPEESL